MSNGYDQMGNNTISHPEDNPYLRYFLLKKGAKNLLIVGLHPNVANSENDDPAIRAMDTIAKNNGYDGWLLVNLYPRRKKSSVDLELIEEKEIFWYNLHLIEYLLDQYQFKIRDAWLAWGDEIDLLRRPYLRQAAGYLYKKLLIHDLNYYSIGRTGKANPRHPAPTGANYHIGPLDQIELLKFDYKHYLRNTKLEPEIKLNGIRFV